MATKIWVGLDSGNEGSISVAANWSPSGVPIDADDVLLGPGGSQAIKGGFDQSAVTLNSLTKTADWGGTGIGSADNYLQWGVSGAVTINGVGRMFLDLGTGTNTATVKVNNTSNNRDDLHIKGNATLVLVTIGKLTWDSGAITDMFVQYRTAPGSNSNVLLSTPTVANCYGLAGLVEMDGAGTITLLRLASSAKALIKEGTLTEGQLYGGLLDYRSTTTLPTCKVFAGMLDATQDQRAKTFTDLSLYGDGKADLAHGAGRITVTNTYEYGINTVKRDL